MIEVSSDLARKRVIAHMSGMLTVADVTNFSEQQQAAVKRMGLKSGGYDLLIIAEGNLVQTKEVMEAFTSLVLRSPVKARKMATVRDGALARMQARRMSRLHGGAETFATLEEAEAWLGLEPIDVSVAI
ncbi:hypothetical protein U1872_20975 [Sphingomonas sp. RB3P16]|uniref:STAS/SEC14 domain-containing protein n=1 Tax=Parasphingomonas frigoris TaxID=3096163 RepID=UPI002FC6F152